MARLIVVEDNPELASLVAAAAGERGHHAHVAVTGQAALNAIAAASYDVAIVDLMLPDLPGTDVLEAMRAARIPALAVSGVFKGEKCAAEAVDNFGARAFFEKPYDLLALLEAAEKSCDAAPAKVPEPALDDLRELETLANDGEDAPPPDEFDLPFTRRGEVWAGSASQAARANLPAWTKAGVIQDGTVPRLLAAYHQARHTGELKLSQGQVVKVVYFEGGVPVYAASNLATERFARFCARKGLFPESELGAVAALAQESGIRTGEALVRLGLVSAERRVQLLEDQVREILWSTFPWNKGEYAFSTRKPSRADLVRLSVRPADLIFEGVMKTETLVSLRRKLPAERRVFPATDPKFELHDVRLNDGQAKLVAAADGSKSVEDLVSITELSERDTLATLYGLSLLGLVEERPDDRARRRISFGL